MRSRYTAYVRGEVDYLVRTQLGGTIDRAAMAQRSKQTLWMGLEIVDTRAGGPTDETGIVEFIARGVTNGKPFTQRERSQFRRVDGAWFYVTS